MYVAVNGFIMLMLVVLFSRNMTSYATSRPAMSVFCAGSVLLSFIYYRDWISSPTPDIPATVYILLIFFLLLQVLLSEQEQILSWRSWTILFIAICLLTIKL